MEIKTKHVLNVINILFWIAFIGLCVKTGSILYSTLVGLFVNPAAAQNLYIELDLSHLYQFDKGYYYLIAGLIIGITALKAYIFYLLIRIISKINLVHPFSREVVTMISLISFIAAIIGIFSNSGISYCDWLISKGVQFPVMHPYLGGGSEFLLFAAVIFFIAQVFKRGLEIQDEHALTV
jgi:hypothetical protein